MNSQATPSRRLLGLSAAVVMLLLILSPVSLQAGYSGAPALQVAATATSTATATGVATATATAVPTATATAVPTATATAVPTATATAVPTATATATMAGHAMATDTPTATATVTAVPPTPTATTVGAPTFTPTATPTITATPTATPVPPTNDDLGSATLIAGFPHMGAQAIGGATAAADDPDMATGSGANSNTVWFRMVAPSGGLVSANTAGSDFDTVLAAFTGPRGHLIQIAGNDDAPSSLQSQISFVAYAGETYYLEAARYGGTPGGGQLHLMVEFTALPPAAPANDDLGSAAAIGAFPFSATLDTDTATVAADDPDLGVTARVNSNTVWYQLSAPTTGRVDATTYGSSYDTVLAAFTGTRGNLTRVAGNDDTAPGFQSQIGFDVQAGTTYYLEVAQYGSTPGGGRLQLAVNSSTTQPVPPANDDFDAATALGAFPYTTTQDTTLATTAADDPPMGVGSGANSKTVWYRLVAPSAGTLSASTSGSSYDTVLAAFTGARGGLTLVASNDDAGFGVQSEIIFGVQAGVTYYLEVAQYGATGGQLQLTVSFSAAATSTPTATPLPPTATPVPATATPVPQPPGGDGGGGGGGDDSGGSGGSSGDDDSGGSGGSSGDDSGGGPAPAAPAPAAPALPAMPLVIPSENPFVAPAPVVEPEDAPAPTGAPGGSRHFDQTGHEVRDDAVWDYFQQRGGVGTFGYPISQEFSLFGYEVQLFQRGLMQRMPDGSITTMNLLDEGLMPYTRINGSTFPAIDQAMKDATPRVGDPDYAERAIAFVHANVPDEWEGMPVNFRRAFLSLVPGDGSGLHTLQNMEILGMPTSRPLRDPNNHNFVYLRFQRGILHYDATNGTTQLILLGDWLKTIMTGQGLPADLEEQARGSALYRVFAPNGMAEVGPGGAPGPESAVASALSADLPLLASLLLALGALGLAPRGRRNRRLW